jgi:hypothetical protein
MMKVRQILCQQKSTRNIHFRSLYLFGWNSCQFYYIMWEPFSKWQNLHEFHSTRVLEKVLEWEVGVGIAVFLCQHLLLDSRCLQKKSMFQFWKMRKNKEMTSTYQSWSQILKGLLYEPSLSFHSSTHCHANQTGTHTHHTTVKRRYHFL